MQPMLKCGHWPKCGLLRFSHLVVSHIPAASVLDALRDAFPVQLDRAQGSNAELLTQSS